MTGLQFVLRRSATAALAGILATSAGLAATAQDKPITPGDTDNAAARDAKRSPLHPTPARTAAGAALREGKTSTARPAETASDAPTLSGAPRYPGDLSYQGGQVVEHAQSHDVYVLNKAVGCTDSSCWGNPERFLKDLAGSEFIHITDQYVGESGNNRYTLGTSAKVTFKLPSVPLTDLDIQAVVHAVASLTHQTGYDHIYHVFLPPGTDECFDSTDTQCYSPDNLSVFAFCAYHSSTDFSDIGHVLYSVEPYQNTAGCNDSPQTTGGQLAGSTDDTLSHELFETITDPDGTAWFNTVSLSLFQQEIGDECVFIKFTPAGAEYGDPPTFNIGERKYAVQAEYDNLGHSCATTP
jgi:hypothetical protein